MRETVEAQLGSTCIVAQLFVPSDFGDLSEWRMDDPDFLDVFHSRHDAAIAEAKDGD